MQVNGREIFLCEPLSLEEFLLRQQYRPDRVVTEVNGEIIRKENFDKVMLRDDDVLEIVSFVGGG